MSFEHLLEMQKQLMEKVPHKVRREIYFEMSAVRDIMEKSLLFLTTLGHKPWRPNPLPKKEQMSRLHTLSRAFDVLLITYGRGITPSLADEEYSTYTRRLISSFGVIEETLEYLDCADGDRAHALEEITDILFFYLEQVILGGFTWQEIEEQYVRKHAINLERYRKAKEGDYSWDKRGEGRL